VRELTAFVLSGGGSLAAVQVGMLAEILAAGQRPDLIVGTSAGAINGAFFAQEPSAATVERMAQLWSRMSTFLRFIAGNCGSTRSHCQSRGTAFAAHARAAMRTLRSNCCAAARHLRRAGDGYAGRAVHRESRRCGAREFRNTRRVSTRGYQRPNIGRWHAGSRYSHCNGDSLRCARTGGATLWLRLRRQVSGAKCARTCHARDHFTWCASGPTRLRAL